VSVTRASDWFAINLDACCNPLMNSYVRVESTLPDFEIMMVAGLKIVAV